MLFNEMVTRVNRLNQSGGDLSYGELKMYFDEAIDVLNQAIFRDLFDYFPEAPLTTDNYVGMPNRFQQRFICHFVAAKSLSELDDYDDQRQEYTQTWTSALSEYVNYYFDEIEPMILEENGAFNVDSFNDYWIDEGEEE